MTTKKSKKIQNYKVKIQTIKKAVCKKDSLFCFITLKIWLQQATEYRCIVTPNTGLNRTFVKNKAAFKPYMLVAVLSSVITVEASILSVRQVLVELFS